MFEELGLTALKIEAGDFLDNYLDANNQERKQYRLDRDLTMTLVTKYDTARRSGTWSESGSIRSEIKAKTRRSPNR